jgi:hypothetical protein
VEAINIQWQKTVLDNWSKGSDIFLTIAKYPCYSALEDVMINTSLQLGPQQLLMLLDKYCE